jgi:hypothetical protein
LATLLCLLVWTVRFFFSFFSIIAVHQNGRVFAEIRSTGGSTWRDDSGDKDSLGPRE